MNKKNVDTLDFSDLRKHTGLFDTTNEKLSGRFEVEILDTPVI